MTTPTIEEPGVVGPNPGLLDWLAAHRVEYELHEHPVSMTALATAHAANVDPRLFVKSLVVELTGGQRILAVVEAADRLDLDRVAGLLSTDSARLIDETELRALAPDFELGTLPPVGQLVGLPTYADRALRGDETITFPAGSHRFTISADRPAWEQATDPTYARLAVDADRGPAWEH